MESSDPLDGDYPAAADYASYLCDRRAVLLPLRKLLHIHRKLRASVGRYKVDLRAAFIAAYRLGIIPSRLRMCVLVLTLRAHREFRHARPDPVIRHAVEYRSARAA